QIVAQRQMRPMLLQDAEWEQACALRPRDGVAELGRGQFLPMHRELGLCRRLRPHGRGAEGVDGKEQGLAQRTLQCAWTSGAYVASAWRFLPGPRRRAKAVRVGWRL